MDPYDLIQSQLKTLPVLLKPEDCHGKVFIVTGATSGIGYECAKHLVGLGAARVILGVRHVGRGKMCKASIESRTKRKDVIDVWHLDYACFESIKTFVNKAEAVLDRIDAMILNAGVSNGRWDMQEGMESNLTVNVMANMLLTTLILPVMEKKGRYSSYRSRIVHVGSRGPFLMPHSLLADVNAQDILADLNNEEKWRENLINRYVLTKLLQHLAVRQLAEKAPASKTGVTINITDPGFCQTGLMKNSNWGIRIIAFIGKLLVGRTAEAGSRNLLAGLVVEDSHGKFLADCEAAEHKIPAWTTDVGGMVFQKQLWVEVAEKLESIEPGCIEVIMER